MTEDLPVRGFDLHCHVDLFSDPAALIAACETAQIVTLAVTTTPLAWAQNRRWTATSPYVHAALGLHPELAGERHVEIAVFEQLLEQARFIGEVGLDTSPQHRKHWTTQISVFNRVLAGAHRLGGRVVSIHSRRAAGEVLRCLDEHTTPDRVLPILHWFSDSATLAQRAVDLGCYFSVNHRMLDSQSGLALIQGLPLERLLTETDAPFTSMPARKSEPIDILATVERLAAARSVSKLDMGNTLTANARRVFAFAGIQANFASMLS